MRNKREIRTNFNQMTLEEKKIYFENLKTLSKPTAPMPKKLNPGYLQAILDKGWQTI